MIENKAASTSNKDANEMAMSSSVCVEKYPRGSRQLQETPLKKDSCD